MDEAGMEHSSLIQTTSETVHQHQYQVREIPKEIKKRNKRYKRNKL
jgi:hypothetical protein